MESRESAWQEADSLLKRVFTLIGMPPIAKGTVELDFHEGALIIVKPTPHLKRPLRDGLARRQ